MIGKPTVNVNYIASQEKFRESTINKMIFGGLTSHELLGEWGKYKSRLLSKNEFEGTKVFQVESALKPESKSVIKRIITLFGTDDFLPGELHFFNSEGKEIRTFKVEETRLIADKKIISKTLMRNHIYQTSVTIETLKMSFPKSIPNKTFTRDHLKSLAGEKTIEAYKGP